MTFETHSPQQTQKLGAALANVAQEYGALMCLSNKGMTRTEGEELYDEMCEMKKDKEGVIARDPSYTTYANMMRIVAIRESAPIYKKLPVSVINLGPVAFVGFGGEPFTHYATAVRENFPNKTVIAVNGTVRDERGLTSIMKTLSFSSTMN